jgi:hypothetical protein
MRRCLNIGLLLVAQHCLSLPVAAAPGAATGAVVGSRAEAEQLAVTAFRKSIKNEIKKFKCSFWKVNAGYWVFACENLDGRPRPGSTYFVEVEMKTGKVNILPGV